MDPKALAVVDRAGQAADLDLAAVARAGVHLADRQRTPQQALGRAVDLPQQLDGFRIVRVERFGDNTGFENFLK